VNIRTYRNIAPVLGARVYVDPAATVIGRVRIGEDSSIWPAAVVRGDVHAIEIGARTSIQDGSVLHVTHDGPYSPGGRSLFVGADVIVLWLLARLHRKKKHARHDAGVQTP